MYSETKVEDAGLGVEEGRGASRCLDLGFVELVVVLLCVICEFFMSSSYHASYTVVGIRKS